MIELSKITTLKKRIGIYLTSSETGAAYMSMSGSDHAETYRLRLDEDGSSTIPTLIEYDGDKVVIGRHVAPSRAFHGIVPVGRISDGVGNGKKYSDVILDYLAEVLKTCSELNGLLKDDITLGAFVVLPVCPEDAAELERKLRDLMRKNYFSWSIGVMAECTAVALPEKLTNNSVIYDFSLNGTRFYYLRRGIKYSSSYSGFDGDMLASALVCQNLGKSYEEFRRMSGDAITQLSSAAFGMIKRYSRREVPEKHGIYLKNRNGSFGDDVYALSIDGQQLSAAADVAVSATISNKLENSMSWKKAAVSFVKTTIDQIVINAPVDSVIVTGDLAEVVSKLDIFGDHAAANALGGVSGEKLRFIGKPTPEDAIRASVEFADITTWIINGTEVGELTAAADEVRAAASIAAAQSVILDYQKAAVLTAADFYDITPDGDNVKQNDFTDSLLKKFRVSQNPKDWAEAYNTAFSKNIRKFTDAVEKYFSDTVESRFTWDENNRGEFIKTALAECFAPVGKDTATDWPTGNTDADMSSYCANEYGTAAFIRKYFTKSQLNNLRSKDPRQLWDNNAATALSKRIAENYNGDDKFKRFAEIILKKLIGLYTMREF